VHRIVTQYHGGHINIAETSSHGTTFAVELPPDRTPLDHGSRAAVKEGR
jgi:signal transduction histidine kinase